MPSQLLNLNSSNYIGNGQYKLDFHPTDFNGSYVSLETLSMYNSIFNITSTYANNNFKIKWIDGTIYDFIIPDSYLEYDDLNAYVEQKCLENNLYMTNTDGDNIYFFKIQTNLNRYKVQLDIFYVPNSANATTLGWVVPELATWTLPINNTTPQIWFNAGLRKIMGFNDDIYYPQTISSNNEVVFSNIVAKLLQVFNIIVCCNFCDNRMNVNDSRILAQIPIKSAFGNLINVEKASQWKFPIKQGLVNECVITLLDQDYRPLKINDTDFSLSLIIEKP